MLDASLLYNLTIMQSTDVSMGHVNNYIIVMNESKQQCIVITVVLVLYTPIPSRILSFRQCDQEDCAIYHDIQWYHCIRYSLIMLCNNNIRALLSCKLVSIRLSSF